MNHTIIQPSKGWKFINFKELWRYKDLLYFMVLRDITVIYKQTVLGFAWAILNPFFSMILFTVVFGKLVNIPSDGIPYPIFSFAGLVPWTYFNQSLTYSTNSLISGSSVFTKVYFPRLIIPLTPALSKLADFFIALVFLFVLMLAFGMYPSFNIIFLPIPLIMTFLTSIGIGMWFSALAVQYRDIKFAVGFIGQSLMYAAPVVFPASLILDNFGETVYFLYGLYPMAGAIEGFRSAIIGINPMPWNLIGMGYISALLIFISGVFYFRRMEKNFADVA